MRRHSVRATAASILSAVVLTACGGNPAEEAQAPAPGTGKVDPPAFAALVRDPRTFTLNVHVPDEGSIEGTDASIPFDQLRSRSDELPPRGTPLAVFCRTGRMSTEATRTLRALGHERVAELRGGMRAWQADGRELLPAETR